MRDQIFDIWEKESIIFDDVHQIYSRDPGEGYERVTFCIHWTPGGVIKEHYVSETGWVHKDQDFPKMGRRDEHELRVDGKKPNSGYTKEI